VGEDFDAVEGSPGVVGAQVLDLYCTPVRAEDVDELDLWSAA